MFSEDDLLPISALQHLEFCERQAALIHVEGQWADNALTVEGTHLHRVVDEDPRRHESRPGVRITRGLVIRSFELGLVGRADVVEFHVTDDADRIGVGLVDVPGRWRPFIVEHKRGRPKSNHCDEVQLCAQALCLEEMFDASVASGQLFYNQTRRRLDVDFDDSLRERTRRAARRFREIVTNRETPIAARQAKCRSCSLERICLPPNKNRPRSARTWLKRVIAP